MQNEEDGNVIVEPLDYSSSLNTYFSKGILPHTKSPRSLRYDTLSYLPTDCASPVILVELLNYLNARVPPLTNLSIGMNKKSLFMAEDLLSCLLQTAGNKDHIRYLITSLPVGVIVQMIQILMLRFEKPPFLASAEFCDYVQRKIFVISPRYGICGRKPHYWSTGRKLVAKCMTSMSRKQQAVWLAMVKICQRWSQEHIAYELRKNFESDATREYTEGICLLSSLFGTSVIDIPKCYTIMRHIQSDYGALANLKMMMFIFLVCMVPHEEWHLYEQKAMHMDVGPDKDFEEEKKQKRK